MDSRRETEHEQQRSKTRQQPHATGPLPKPNRPKVIFSDPPEDITLPDSDSKTLGNPEPARSDPARSDPARLEVPSPIKNRNSDPDSRSRSEQQTERHLQPASSNQSQGSGEHLVSHARSEFARPDRVATYPNRPSGSQRVRANAAASSGGLNGLYFLLASAALMFGMWFIGPRLVEEYHYAAERGKTRAVYENAVTQLGQQPLADVSNAYQLVAQRIRPSVVSVNAMKSSGDGNGLGSGVIMSADGYILTNAHVLEDASRLLIELHDRRRFEASIIGSDPTSDLALLKINAPDLIPATWGDSDQVDVGSIVWAIGSPYGFQQTVTSGIISGKDRPGDPMHLKQSLLQTDAAVNPGNSGGPLVDAQGLVIGINTSIFGKTFQGISFAVPSATAKFVYQELLKNGKVTRGYLGVLPSEVNHNDAVQMQLPDLDGAKLNHVQPNSPAYLAGIRSGDVIRSWDGVEIKEFRDLYRVAETTVPDSRVQVTLIRDGEERSTQVVVGELPEEPSFRQKRANTFEQVRRIFDK